MVSGGRRNIGIRVQIMVRIGLLGAQEHLLAKLVACIERILLLLSSFVAGVIRVAIIRGPIQVSLPILVIEIVLDLSSAVDIVRIFRSCSVLPLLTLVLAALVALVLDYV